MEDVEEELSMLSELVNIEIGRREKRPLCSRCRRPRGVCWCGGVGGAAVGVKSKVVVLQHPHEQKRCLRTAPMLTAALPPSHCLLLRGKRFPLSRFPELAPILSSRQTILMYPGGAAVGVEGLARVGRGGQAPYNIVILDGTWQQAKSIYYNCPALHVLPQVCLSGRYTSEYIIRTQPTQDALSTVETAALALAILEENWALYDPLVEPLRVLCRHQIQHGAVAHQSKEEMIISGRCRKPLGKRTYKKLRKCGARHSDALLASMVMSGAALGPQNTTSALTNTSAGLDGDGDSGDDDKDTVMARDDYGKSRVEIGEPREEIGKSREESGESRVETDQSRVETSRSREGSGKSRVEVIESREEISESRLETGQSRVKTDESRAETGRSRVEASRSMVETDESRVETSQSRVELTETREESDEYGAELSKSRVELGQFGVKVGELRKGDKFREKTLEYGEEREKSEKNARIRTKSEKECKKEAKNEEEETEERKKRENSDRRGRKDWIKTGNEEKEEGTVENKKEREMEAKNDDKEDEERKERENNDRIGSKDWIKRGDEEKEEKTVDSKKETETEAGNDDKEEEERNKRRNDDRRESKDGIKIGDREEEERKREEVKEEKRENMIKVRNISSHVCYELR